MLLALLTILLHAVSLFIPEKKKKVNDQTLQCLVSNNQTENDTLLVSESIVAIVSTVKQ